MWIDTEDLSWGRCPATFSARVTAQTSGAVSSVQARWSDPASGAAGSVTLGARSAGRFSGKLTGLPVGTPVLVVVEAGGPGGSSTTEPTGLSHNC